MAWKNIISQSDAHARLGNPGVKFVDGSWYLPAQNRNGPEEFHTSRIPGAVFFDIDDVSDKTSQLPHMLPTPEYFADAVRELGIADKDEIIVYDGPGMFSAPRVWWTFSIMGASNVKILEGGIDAWKAAELPTETGTPKPPSPASFNASFAADRVATQAELVASINDQQATVLDARPFERFTGEGPEPRPGLRSGRIPGSRSVPATSLVSNGTLKPLNELHAIFASGDIAAETDLVTSCGSGVTAAIIALALDEAGYQNVRLYDGSWAEWGMPNGPEIETGS